MRALPVEPGFTESAGAPGPLGALLAVPMTLLAKALLVDADPAARWLRPLPGDTAAEGLTADVVTSARPGR
ncbi:hypothetical protein [Pseudofrankia sp. BMG5.37]|uniref:hypothetical protein n=1 Tax=Pseudofrankia sp. BMG5.37 TaxID=3050035 RepID=UPI0008DA2A39|nr:MULTISPECIES: hypothetical protein [unclassified Pseudofrankia]MDT3437999.1 hypothetical protein [Pseudofrankia sp. BMG5.37]OHV57267.1 hypothetical protein BCD48_06560 [Pseudofrankia sp. BMG5.36]